MRIPRIAQYVINVSLFSAYLTIISLLVGVVVGIFASALSISDPEEILLLPLVAGTMVLIYHSFKNPRELYITRYSVDE